MAYIGFQLQRDGARSYITVSQLRQMLGHLDDGTHIMIDNIHVLGLRSQEGEYGGYMLLKPDGGFVLTYADLDEWSNAVPDSDRVLNRGKGQ